MGVGFGSYDIARSGMYVAERSLNATGHNIANENTVGYVRQRANVTTSHYIGMGRFQYGLGASVSGVVQLRHNFLDNAYRSEVKHLGYWEARQKTLQDVQNILGEPTDDGLQGVMNEFWDSWQELSKNPESLTVRSLTRQRGFALVEKLNHIGAQLDQLQKDLNAEMQKRIAEINQITGKIADLNKSIVSAEFSGERANDLRDQRNHLIDQLAQYMDIDITEMPDGYVNVIASGAYLVSKDRNRALYGEFTEQNGTVYVIPRVQDHDMKMNLKSGSIKGLMDSNMEDVANLKEELNLMVKSMAMQINEHCRNGYNLNGGKGTDFFVRIKSTDDFMMGNIQINGNLDDLNNIVASAVADSSGVGLKGDNTAALAIANVRNNIIVWKNKEMLTQGKIGPPATGGTYTGAAVRDAAAVDTTLDDRIIVDGHEIRIDWDALDWSAVGGIEYIQAKRSAGDVRNVMELVINQAINKYNEANGIAATSDAVKPVTVAVEGDGLKILSGSTGTRSEVYFDYMLEGSVASFYLSTGRRFSIDSFYKNIILDVGNQGIEADRGVTSQKTLVDQADGLRKSIASVSLDEEMANMLKFQFAYSASSRTMNVLDEMMETVISRMGLTGR